MMVTIPLPIPVPTIIKINNEIRIDRTRTELAKKKRELGEVLSLDDKDFIPICCACKEFGAYIAEFDAPIGFKYGGWFCDYCLSQGRLAHSLRLIIDQIICDIEPVFCFDQRGIPCNVSQPIR